MVSFLGVAPSPGAAIPWVSTSQPSFLSLPCTFVYLFSCRGRRSEYRKVPLSFLCLPFCPSPPGYAPSLLEIRHFPPTQRCGTWKDSVFANFLFSFPQCSGFFSLLFPWRGVHFTSGLPGDARELSPYAHQSLVFFLRLCVPSFNGLPLFLNGKPLPRRELFLFRSLRFCAFTLVRVFFLRTHTQNFRRVGLPAPNAFPRSPLSSFFPLFVVFPPRCEFFFGEAAAP